MASIISAGTTSGTSLNLSGDTSGVLQLATNGSTTAITVDTSQNVGIGTASPSFFAGGGLQVSNATQANLRLSDTTNAAYNFDLFMNDADAYAVNRTSGPIVFGTNNIERMRIDSSGNVGIGTTSPQSTVGVNVALTDTKGVVLQYSGEAKGGILLNPTSGEVRMGAINTTGTYFTTLYANNAERMRIDSSGNVGIGTTTPSSFGKLAVVGTNISSTLCAIRDTGTPAANLFVVSANSLGTAFSINSLGYAYVDSYLGVQTAAATTAVISVGVGLNQRDGIRISTNQSPASGSFISFYNLSGNVAGSITHTGTTTVAYNTSSDYRLKENIAPMTGALAKVQALKPCTYTWKEDGTSGEGFIAHELQEVCPQAVTFEKDAVDAEGNPKYQGVDTSFLVATLTAAIQEQQAMIETLQAEVAALKGVN